MSGVLMEHIEQEIRLQDRTIPTNAIFYTSDFDNFVVVVEYDGRVQQMYDYFFHDFINFDKLLSNQTEDGWRKRFSWVLKRKMWQRGIMQTDLADKVEVSQKTISNLLNGRTTPNGYLIGRLERVLNCRPGELLNPMQ